ncbi:vomeronasal type-1 receptor 4-like [Octodon degus]|uniref:Vomeronasal type-1 receptor n=1 Tax=Octodon degus TaxID=10160 RepID=A0A6P3V917_OCTDE|nr:vomeronasal type-1 receptor 4-like [Octodon degus]
MENNRMTATQVSIEVLFLGQIIIGTIGNLSLLGQYVFLYVSGYKPRSSDLILRHLTVANTLVILSRGIPETMAALGVKDFLTDVGCKLIFYVHRVGRGVSIGSTCLLSVFQVTIIVPRSSRWANIKAKFPKYLEIFITLCWTLNMIVNIIFPVQITAKSKNKNITNEINFEYCSAPSDGKVLRSVNVALFSISDGLCIGLMLWASGFMVFTLQRHKQQVRHMHRANVSCRTSPVTRATKRILVLVCLYVKFYTMSCIIQACMPIFHNPSTLLLTLAALMNIFFPTACPLLLMNWTHTSFCFCQKEN